MRTKIPVFLAGIVCSLAASGATRPAGAPAPIDPALIWTARESSEWKPVDMSRMVVEPGSILDVSRFIEIPAGKHGRIIIGADGHFAYENAPGIRIRFHGATLHPARELKRWYPDKAAIARLAEQLRRQGYNFVRLMSLDVWLMDESDTGELRLSRDERLLQVDTARLQGACLDPAVTKLPVDLAALRIVSLEAAGSLAVVSTDDQPLNESGRILLVYATDALNQGMTFRDASREELVAIGQATTLLRGGKIYVQLKTNHAAQFKLWALGLGGKRDEELPVKAVAGRLEILIDTGKLRNGPTPYFELAVL